MVKFKDFSRPLSVFQVLFKANFIFKDFTRQACIFKYFSSLCEPCKGQSKTAESCHDTYLLGRLLYTCQSSIYVRDELFWLKIWHIHDHAKYRLLLLGSVFKGAMQAF